MIIIYDDKGKKQEIECSLQELLNNIAFHIEEFLTYRNTLNNIYTRTNKKTITEFENIIRGKKSRKISKQDIKHIKELMGISLYDDIDISMPYDEILTKGINNIKENGIFIREEINYILQGLRGSYNVALNLTKNTTSINYESSGELNNSLFIIKSIFNSNDLDENIDKLYDLYISGNFELNIIILCFLDAILKLPRMINYFDILNKFTEPIIRNKKAFYRIIKDIENCNEINYEDIEAMLLSYNNSFYEMNKDTIKQEVNRYNENVRVQMKENQKSSQIKVEKHYETREERISRYNSQDSDYNDAGEVKLSEEELEVIDLYFEVIENLPPNEIEKFENKTTEYIPLFPGIVDEYTKPLIDGLIEKINKSEIEPSYKKKIIKGVSHLI